MYIIIIDTCRAIEHQIRDDANHEEDLQIVRFPSQANKEIEKGESGNANGEEVHVVGRAAYAHSATAAVFTDSAAAIMREQVFLKVEINEEDPNTMNIQIFARREFILFALELPCRNANANAIRPEV